jgi:hypothetical protein
VQEVLTRPGTLERFLAPSEDAAAVRESWVGMWSLDVDGGAGADEAVRRAEELVLKPQREGGGNNVYRGNIPPFVARLPVEERAAWVAMELIRPPRGGVRAHLVRSGAGRVDARVMSELGVFGWALFGEGGEVREDQAGWLVRTKADDVDEGGVATGFSVLDSVVLVDDSQGKSSRIGTDCFIDAVARRSKLECNTRHELLPYVHRNVGSRMTCTNGIRISDIQGHSQYDPANQVHLFGEGLVNPGRRFYFGDGIHASCLDLFIHSLSSFVCPGADTLKARRLGSFLFSLDPIRFVYPWQDCYGREPFFLLAPFSMERIGPRLDFVNDADNGPSLVPRVIFIIHGR